LKLLLKTTGEGVYAKQASLNVAIKEDPCPEQEIHLGSNCITFFLGIVCP